MNPEQEAELCQLGPGVFSRIRSFGCDAGWFDLLEKLVVILQAEIDRLPEAERDQFYAVRVKEKFGGLQFYMNRGNAAMSAAIKRAEELSYKTCEECGAPGECQTIRNWTQTLCEVHKQEKIHKQEKLLETYLPFLKPVPKKPESP